MALFLGSAGCVELDDGPDLGSAEQAVIDCSDPANAEDPMCAGQGGPSWVCNPVVVYCGGPDGYSSDGDSLADGAEDCLLQASNARLYFDGGENKHHYDDNYYVKCYRHDGIYARVHQPSWDSVEVHTVISYRRDCGDTPDPLAGFSNHDHDGDSEGYVVYWSYWGNGYWYANSAYLKAHEGESTDSSTWNQVCGPGSYGHSWVAYENGRIVIFAAENKHGSYPTLSVCDHGGWNGSDHCGRLDGEGPSPGAPYGYHWPAIYDVGEPGYRLLESPYDQPSESFWAAQKYCGNESGNGSCPQSGCSSPLHEKLGFDGFGGDSCTTGGGGGMCGDSCGGSSGYGCWCDAACANYGDCCGDGSACYVCGYC